MANKRYQRNILEQFNHQKQIKWPALITVQQRLMNGLFSTYEGCIQFFINQQSRMGSVMFRNRYWFYKSLYDDYMGREFKLAFGLSCVIWMPHYWYGIHLNRTIEEGSAHKNYFVEYNPRRNRLTHNLQFEEFEMILENWVKLEQQYNENGGKLKALTQ